VGTAMKRVLTFFVRRLAAAIFTLLTLIAITFVVYWALPSTPATFLYSSQHLTDYQIKNTNHLFGLDRPKVVQYVDYVAHLARGDLGRSWTDAQIQPTNRLVQTPIGPFLFQALGVTLSIILGGAFFVLLLSVPLGALAGSRVGTWSDRTISIVALIGVCTHPMVLGGVLQHLFARLGVSWPPLSGYCPLTSHDLQGCGGPVDWAGHLVLPWLTFSLLFLALYTRMVRASVAETLHEDFVRTARAKGAGEARVLRVHVLPSASLRVLTMVGMEIGTAIGVCVYIEAVYGMFGLGREAIFAMGGASSAIDLPLTLGVVSLVTLVVVVGNLAVDLLYAVLDPRTGRESTGSREKSLAGGVI
jgi:peptide/nickel transport system permease protein